MEELYEDLENYNEVNALQELRAENKDLKLKLEEYEKAMEKLQKDYDNLSMEFHNLQTNYSSLLKTARAEVERKTKLITQLNHEKDEMVIKALSGNRKMLYNRNNPHKGPQNFRNTNRTQKDTNQIQNDNKKGKSEQTKENTGNKNQSGISTKGFGTVSEKTQRFNTKILDKVLEKVESFTNKDEIKLSNKPVQNIAPKTSASSIKNRRKSMPALSFPEFSSDEENEPKRSVTPIRTVISPFELTENRNTVLQRNRYDSLNNKMSESPGVDDKSPYYQEGKRESTRNRFTRKETDKKSNERFRDSDKFKQVDKYREGDTYREVDKYRGGDKYREVDKHRENNKSRDFDRHKESDKFKGSDKYREGDRHRENDKFRGFDKSREGDRFRNSDKYSNRKRHSPDRPPKRSYREFQDEHNRYEHGKYRVLESPTVETPSHSTYHRRVLESPPVELHSHSSYHRKSQENWPNFERHSHDSDKYNTRYDERHVKRYSKPNQNDYDEPSSKRQKVEPDKHLEENKRQEVVPKLRQFRPEAHDLDALRISCQSPDAVFSPETYTDATFEHTIKEIKNTAVMPLEDPRVTSKKYILKTENGKPTLTTVDSKDIDIVPVDKVLWKIQSVAVPEALLNKPPTPIHNRINEIYMDIDNNPEMNASVESGEIYSNLDDDVTNTIFDKNHENVESVEKNSKLNVHVAKSVPTTISPSANERKSSSDIPKMKHNDEVNIPGVNKVIQKNIPQDQSVAGKSLPKASQSSVIPQSVSNKPATTLDKNLRDIYMDIDGNPETNVSIESGEICSDLVDEIRSTVTKNSQEKTIHVEQNNKLTKNPVESIPVSKTPGSIPKATSSFRIPKIKKDNETKVSDTHIPKTMSKDSSTAIKTSPKENQISKKPQSLPNIDFPLRHENDYVSATTVKHKTHDSKESRVNKITLSDMAMVQDDLELSDETSDNADLHTHIVLEKTIDQKVQSKAVEKTAAAENKNEFNTKAISKETVKELPNVAPDEKPKETESHKKQRSKRRKTKSNEKELTKDTDKDVQSTEKKTRVKKDKDPKPKQIKNKFTDLFGDSSSLITPEDLGIPASCVPLCEDAQDAVDVNINEIVKAPLPAISNDCHKSDIREETKNDNLFSNPNTEDIEIAKRIEEQIQSPIVDTKTVYQNINSEVELHKPDIVKTVIISSGIQPQFALSNKNGTKERRVADVEVDIQNIADSIQPPVITGLKNQNPMIALATSTPHKEFSVSLDTESKTVDSSNNRSDSKNESADASVHSLSKSDTNTQSGHDAPDVRIFVRRRKKGIKKT